MTPFALVIKQTTQPGKREGLDLRVLRTAVQSNHDRFVQTQRAAQAF